MKYKLKQHVKNTNNTLATSLPDSAFTNVPDYRLTKSRDKNITFGIAGASTHSKYQIIYRTDNTIIFKFHNGTGIRNTKASATTTRRMAPIWADFGTTSPRPPMGQVEMNWLSSARHFRANVTLDLGGGYYFFG